MIRRLRARWPVDVLDEMYAEPHDHRAYGLGHHLRVELTVLLAEGVNPRTVADLSCGNGTIARKLAPSPPILGDIAPGYPIVGPIEDTLATIEPVDLYVCSETLEHLNDPPAILERLRAHRRLLLSTPIEAWADTNTEHYWAWDRDGVEMLLAGAGWTVERFALLDARTFGESYCYGVWLAR